MEYSVVGSFRRAMGKVGAAFTGAWNFALDFVGVTEDSSLWWKSVFERKILKGDVGISSRWFHSKKIDVLWELQSLVESLSDEHQGSAENLKDIAQAVKSTSSFNPPGTGQDCNVINYWFNKHASNVDSRGVRCHEDLNNDHTIHDESVGWWGQSTDGVYEYAIRKLNQAQCDFNQSSAFYSGDTISDALTSSDLNCKHIRHMEHAAQEPRPRCDLTSPFGSTRVKRSASSPDLLLGQDSCKSDSQVFRLRLRTSSLPSLCALGNNYKCINCLKMEGIPNVDIRNQCSRFIHETASAYSHTNKTVNPACAEKDESGSVGKDRSAYESDLDKLLEHQNALRFLWEDNFSPEMEIQNANDFCCLCGNVQTTVKRSRFKINNNSIAINCNSDGQNTDGGKCRGNNLLKRRREGFHDCDTVITSSDSPKNTKSSPIKMLKGNYQKNTMAAGGSVKSGFQCGDDDNEDNNNEFCNQINWNALPDLDRSSGSPVDQQTLQWRNSGPHPTSTVLTSPKKTASSSAGSSTQSHPHAISGRKKRYGCIRNCCQKSMLDNEDFKSTPLRKAKQSMDLANQDLVETTEMSDVTSLKCDASSQPQELRHYPKISIGRCLGLEGVELPEPPRFDVEDETDARSPSSLLKLVRSPLNFIQTPIRWFSSFWTGGEEGRLDQQKRSSLYGSRSSSEPACAHKSGTEAKYDILRLQAERNYFMRVYKWKQDTLMDVVRIAKDYYSDPTEMNLARWKFLKKTLPREHQSFTDVRMAVSKIPDYFPYFTIFLTMVQTVILCVMCQRYGLATAGVVTLIKVQSNIPTFLGTETFRHLEEPNPWLGPPVNHFIAIGAVLAACTGPLEQLKEVTTSKGYKIMAERNRRYFGCCEMESLFNRAGTTTQLECEEMSSGLGKWKMGMLCSDRPSTQNSIAHVIRPCCTGYHGECMMASHEHCDFIKGVFHIECDHCVQVNCLIELCNMSSGSHEGDEAPWLPNDNTEWQWWRYLTAIPLVYGIIHLIVLMPLQLTMMLRLEMCVGWHRVALLYISSSIAGEMVGRNLEPLVPHVGSTSGLGGVMGVAVIELFQAWSFLRCPQWEVIKLSTFIVLILFMGTFYLISAISFITGLVVGMMICLVIIPYITYGRRLGHFRGRLVLAGLILIVITLSTVKQLLHLLKNCHACLILECVPYTAGVCLAYYQNLHKLNDQ